MTILLTTSALRDSTRDSTRSKLPLASSVLRWGQVEMPSRESTLKTEASRLGEKASHVTTRRRTKALQTGHWQANTHLLPGSLSQLRTAGFPFTWPEWASLASATKAPALHSRPLQTILYLPLSLGSTCLTQISSATYHLTP